MANNVLTYGLIVKRALQVLENNLVYSKKIYRGYEAEFDKTSNGYKPGDTITVRRPAEFVVRDGPTFQQQDAIEGSLNVKVDRVKGVDLVFSTKDMTLDITDFSERFIEPAMIAIAQQIDSDVSALALSVNNWVGTPGNLLTTFDSIAQGTQRLDDLAVTNSDRIGIINPANARSLQSSLVGGSGVASVFAPGDVQKVYRDGALPPVDGVELYKSQNAPVLTTGTRNATGALNNGTLAVNYLTVKDNFVQTFTMSGLGANATVKKGEVFTLANVFEVNPRSKLSTGVLKQIVVTDDVTADGAGAAQVTAYPPIITSGAFQNASNAPASNAVVTWKGSASTAYQQNVIFNKDAFALTMVPLEPPRGNVKWSRATHAGFSVRMVDFYDGVNDNNLTRLDVLYGVTAVDPRKAVRLSGI